MPWQGQNDHIKRIAFFLFHFHVQACVLQSSLHIVICSVILHNCSQILVWFWDDTTSSLFICNYYKKKCKKLRGEKVKKWLSNDNLCFNQIFSGKVWTFIPGQNLLLLGQFSSKLQSGQFFSYIVRNNPPKHYDERNCLERWIQDFEIKFGLRVADKLGPSSLD